MSSVIDKTRRWVSDTQEPEPKTVPIPRPPGSQGAIALVLEQSGWATPASPAACVSDLQAAQLRLLLCFLQQERLTENCAVVPEGGEVFEIVAACFTVPSPASDSCSAKLSAES